MCIIQRSCQRIPINLPCKLHLKVSLVSPVALVADTAATAEKKTVPACSPCAVCGDGSSSREQTPDSLQFSERH